MIFDLTREMTSEEEKIYKESLKKDSEWTGITLWGVNPSKTINLYQERREEEKIKAIYQGEL